MVPIAWDTSSPANPSPRVISRVIRPWVQRAATASPSSFGSTLKRSTSRPDPASRRSGPGGELLRREHVVQAQHRHRDLLDERPEQLCQVWLAQEFMQHTGSFKARGAQNFLQAHRDAGALPGTGATIASGGNAGLACAWAAQQQGVQADVFPPATAPRVKVARLRSYGAEVRLTGPSTPKLWPPARTSPPPPGRSPPTPTTTR